MAALHGPPGSSTPPVYIPDYHYRIRHSVDVGVITQGDIDSWEDAVVIWMGEYPGKVVQITCNTCGISVNLPHDWSQGHFIHDEMCPLFQKEYKW